MKFRNLPEEPDEGKGPGHLAELYEGPPGSRGSRNPKRLPRTWHGEFRGKDDRESLQPGQGHHNEGPKGQDLRGRRPQPPAEQDVSLQKDCRIHPFLLENSPKLTEIVINWNSFGL